MSQVATLKDGIKVEIDENTSGYVAGFESINLSEETLGTVKTILQAVANNVSAAWQAVSDKVVIDSTEIELGLSVDGEAGWFIAKAGVGANLKIKVVLKRPAQ